ncbi:MAG: DUF5615 family PIN-like protein [Bryobacteraceae bacterium]
MKILIDMNLSPEWVSVFLRYGIEAKHWSSVGDPRAPDTEIMEWARRRSFVVFTHDLDFGTLLASNRSGAPSVIQVRFQDVFPAAIEHIVIAAIHQCQQQLEAGALATIDGKRLRVRILPLS